MKILWVVNFIFPDVADKLGMKRNISGGWLLDLSKQISTVEDINLTIVSMYPGNELKKYDINGITYYLIPGGGKKAMFYTKALGKYWDVIDRDIDPDIVHLHGTEFTHGEVYLDLYPNRKFLLTVQGMLGHIAREATAGIPFSVRYFGKTLSEWVKFNGMSEVKWLFSKNSKHEKSIIAKVDYVTGRTFWDEQIVKCINPGAKYYRCFYNLREEFYSAAKWDIEKIDRHTVYAGTAAQVSYKGGHIIVRAFKEVLKFVPDAKLILILNLDPEGNPVPKNGFQKYILKLIKKLGIRENVKFIPPQKADEVIRNMQKAHCMVVASSMENASSTLREGMHIGVPSVASYRGGMTYLIKDGEDGFFYDFPEYEYLAGRICQIFNDDALAKSISQKAIAKAERWHDRDKNRDDFINLYRQIEERKNI